MKNFMSGLEDNFEKRIFLSKHGFVYDAKYDVYTKDGKAFSQNIGNEVSSIDELKAFVKNNPDNHKYDWIIDMMADGYEMEIGAAQPIMGATSVPEMHGVYCKNYIEMAERGEPANHRLVGEALNRNRIKRDVGKMFGGDVTQPTIVEEALAKARKTDSER